MEGNRGLGVPRISTLAADAIAAEAFGQARHAAQSWYLNKPALEVLARSLDPNDRFVGRAQALLDDMAPLEPQLPDLFELIGDADERSKTRWLTRTGRRAAQADDREREQATGPVPDVRSPLRPENIKPGFGYSELAAAAIGGVTLGWAELNKDSPAADPLQRGAADMIDRAVDSPDYAIGFTIGAGDGCISAIKDVGQGFVDLGKLISDLMLAHFEGGDLGVLFALRDKVMSLVGAAEHIPAAVKWLADRWNDGSDPYKQGAFQGQVCGYVATQVAFILASEVAIPVAGPFRELIALLKLVADPVGGLVEISETVRAARGGVTTAMRAEHAAADAAHAGAAGEQRLGDTLGEATSHPLTHPTGDATSHPLTHRVGDARTAPTAGPTGRPVVLEPYVGTSLDSSRQLAREHPGSQVVAAEAYLMPSPEDIAKFRAEGGEFLAERFAESLPPSSVDKIFVRYPMPQAKGIENKRFAVAERAQELVAEGVPYEEAMSRAMARTAGEVESITNLGPHAIEKLAPGGTMEIVYWEKDVYNEIASLVGHKYMDPTTGSRFTLEITQPPTPFARENLPNSGKWIPDHITMVHEVVVTKVVLP